ncbi:MAG: 50S ribosomal protein L29 [Actinomycetota bacterium]|nr:50S ribosomal protein L29 [Actinomycetota bacterium]
MKAIELRELPEEELRERLAEHKEELFNLRFQHVTGQLDNPHRMKQVKGEIARVLTVLREREFDATTRTTRTT